MVEIRGYDVHDINLRYINRLAKRATMILLSAKEQLMFQECTDIKAVHPQILFLKYIMLITVNKNFTIVIPNYTRYNRYKEIIQIN